MSIGVTTTLLPRAPIRDKLCQEDSGTPPQGTARYWDLGGKDHHGRPIPGLRVDVVYDTLSKQKFVPKENFKGETTPFESRDALLDHEVARRMEAVSHLPDDKRYVGFQLTLLQKIKRLFGMYIDDELQADWKNVLKPNYSAKNVHNMEVSITPSRQTRDSLKLASHETYKLNTKVSWCFNSSLNGYQYVDESGRVIQIHSAPTASSDRTTQNICMMRRFDDGNTGESIAYTGRPDTREKAIEQLEFIFRSEMAKDPSVRKVVQDEEGTYQLTYLVNNLMNPVTGIGWVLFDEKRAVLEEQEVMQHLAGQTFTIDGKTVQVDPLYFSQPFNQTLSLRKMISDAHSGKKIAEAINASGYHKLLKLAEAKMEEMPEGPKQELIAATIRTLREERASLLPEEELFNRALLAQFLNLPIVTHCKSSTDRTILALATVAIAYQWNQLSLDPIRDSRGQIVPHLILREDTAKELFVGHCLAGHQVTRVSRTCEGVVKGHEIGTRILGYVWASNPIAGRMLPERYTKENNVPITKQGVVGLGTLMGFTLNLILAPFIFLVGSLSQGELFDPFFFKLDGLPFADRLVDKHSPYVGKGKGRSILKPSGMVHL